MPVQWQGKYLLCHKRISKLLQLPIRPAERCIELGWQILKVGAKTGHLTKLVLMDEHQSQLHEPMGHVWIWSMRAIRA